jgi:hypothetical protein
MPKHKNKEKSKRTSNSKLELSKTKRLKLAETLSEVANEAGDASASDTKSKHMANALASSKLINAHHLKAQNNEKEALSYGWKAGTELEKAKKEIDADHGYGKWNKYLKEHCSTLSRTTVWRYRQIATRFTLKQVGDMTLTEAYTEMGDLRLNKESIPSESGIDPKSERKPVPNDVLMMNLLTKSARHFNQPEKLAGTEKSSLKRILVRLVEVFNTLEDEVWTWTKDESDLITALYKNVQAVKGKA